jgi:hypothetical protein
MGKKHKISYFCTQIGIEIYYINILLNLITSCKVETMPEVMSLAELALEKGKKIDRNNEKIGKILGY